MWKMFEREELIIYLHHQVMVMTAGTSRYRKTSIVNGGTDSNKELNQHEPIENDAPVADNVDLLTNDEGDVFYGIAPKISLKLDDAFQARQADLTLEKGNSST